MPPRLTNHQLYLNGQKVLKGVDYVLIGPVENMTPAFKFQIRTNDKIVLVLPQRDHTFVEVDLEPDNVHRLCDRCGKNSMPQTITLGSYYPEFPKSVCVPCTVRALRKEIAQFREVIAERQQQLRRYKRLFQLASRKTGTRDFRALMTLLDGQKRMMDLVSSTDELVGRSKHRLAELQNLVSELKKPKRLVNILR